MTENILVLGVGNTLLPAEGAGIHVINRLQTTHPDLPNVTLLDGGTLSFTLAEPIAQAWGLIVVDATRLQSSPGTVREMHGNDMDCYLSTASGSVHEVGLRDLLDIAILSETLPVRRCLVGIEPESVGWGELPTSSVAIAINDAADRILRIIDHWRQG